MPLPSTRVEEFSAYMQSVRSPNTARSYVDGAERFLLFLGRHGVPFAKMPPNILSLYAEHLAHQKKKPSTISVYISAAKKFIAWSNNKGDTDVRVHTSIDLPRINKLPPNTLRPEHILAYLSLASRLPEPRRSALLLLPYCGLRCFELISLRLESISTVKKHMCFTLRGKGGDTRVVPVLLDGSGILVKYLQTWRRFVRNRLKTNYLLCDRVGTPISARTLRGDMKKIRDTIGIDRLTLHTLRRVYLTTLQRAGVDVATITRVAGHKSFSTTMSHYIELYPEDIVGSLEKAGARLIEQSDYAKHVGEGQKNVLDFLKNRDGAST